MGRACFATLKPAKDIGKVALLRKARSGIDDGALCERVTLKKEGKGRATCSFTTSKPITVFKDNGWVNINSIH